jgi:hypothetical protein
MKTGYFMGVFCMVFGQTFYNLDLPVQSGRYLILKKPKNINLQRSFYIVLPIPIPTQMSRGEHGYYIQIIFKKINLLSSSFGNP